MTARRRQSLPDSVRPRRYWVVSPNVNNKDRIVERWCQLSLRERAAFMGYGRDHPIGRRFVHEISDGDVILIARRADGEPNFVGYGVVRGKAVRLAKDKNPPGGSHRALRRLRPFKTNRPPPGIHLREALRHTMSLVERDPAAHHKLCHWMDAQLRMKRGFSDARTAESGERPSAARDTLRITGLPARCQLEYEVRSKSTVAKAKRTELKLLKDYERWLLRRGRYLQRNRFGRLECDAYEPRTRNLIEAKSSTKREYVRMGVGQLFDYAFQGYRDRHPHMALLLPRKPDLGSLRWLERLKIKLVWRQGKQFKDNAHGRFTARNQQR